MKSWTADQTISIETQNFFLRQETQLIVLIESRIQIFFSKIAELICLKFKFKIKFYLFLKNVQIFKPIQNYEEDLF